MTDLTLTLAGPVLLTDAHGHDRTPSSMKARGLLALLGTARDLRMSRVKLRDKLWSDRFPEQATSSLRQALTDVRRGLGPLRDALLDGPGWVGLDPGRVAVVLQPPADAAPGTIEFAENLSVADPEFRRWLSDRQRHFDDLWRQASVTAVSDKGRPATGPGCLVLSPARTGRDDLDRLVDMALGRAAHHAAEFLPLRVFVDRGAAGDFADAMNLVATGAVQDGRLELQVTLVRLRTGEQLLGRTFQGGAAIMAGRLDRLSGKVTTTILDALSLSNESGGAAIGVSLSDVFSFSGDRLLRAEQGLAALPESHVTLAMRAYVRNTQFVERLVPERQDLLAEATGFAARALEMAPHNATALAVAAMIASQRQDMAFSGDLAQRAVRIDRTNPLARVSLALALAAGGRHEQAHAEALRARGEARSGFSPASWAAYCALTAIRARRFEEAQSHAQIAHGYAPAFRPALRFLAALCYRLGDEAGAERALRKLRALEPDFSLELMASQDYPVASLRAANLMEITRSRLI